MSDHDDEQPPHGTRKDGKPFKVGNTREDGSYRIGKGRTDERTRFAAGDGRKRGRRAKGTRNLSTDWKEELSEMVDILENGKKKRVTKQRAIVKAAVNGAMKGQDRKVEIAHRRADELDASAHASRRPDDSVVDAWLDDQFNRRSHDGGIISDDDPTKAAKPKEPRKKPRRKPRSPTPEGGP